jgi:GH24 family phage-related lysozyme (muramidase)/peptidoglycan hydrolase-like protein with peptidoglycan-binding domain
MTQLTRQNRDAKAPVQNKMDDAASSASQSFAPPAFQLKTAEDETQTAQRQEDPGVSNEVTEEVGEHLSLREGFRRQVYLDSRGLPTAGTGHLLSRAEKARYPVGTTIPDSILEAWRVADSENAYSAAVQMSIDMDYESQDMVNALTAVNFQLGTAWNQEHKKTWGYLKAHNWESAAHEAADSSWFSQTPVRVIDFQRSLLNIAGKPTDYDSMVTFNAADIRKRNVTMPGARNVEAFEVGEHTAPGQEAAAGGGQAEAAAPEAQEQETQAPPVVAAPVTLSGSVGLNKDGAMVGSKTNTKKVQEHLISAGVLPAETMGRSGKMVTNADGYIGNATVAAIKAFQQTIMGWSRQDGLVEAGGKTWAKLATFTAAPANAPQDNDDSSGTGGGTVEGPQEPVKEETAPVNEVTNSDANEQEGGTQVSGPTASETVTFDQISTGYRGQFSISGSVGNGGSNSATDMEKVKMLLRLAGYKTDLLSNTGTEAQKRRKRMVQMKNCIFHFQNLYKSELSTDARVDPNGGTWKKMVEVAYQNSGGQPMNGGQLTALNDSRKGEASDVPSDLKANITNGHLLGIDNSGYKLPNEFAPDARRLKTALETIKSEIGNYAISCGYRSPEHNVKIGSTASMSQHVQGIAADIQSNGSFGPSALKTKLKQLIAQGKIPAGGLGLYSWGVHYDIRGSLTEW